MLVSIVGTITMVRALSGTPSEKSRRGSRFGAIRRLAACWMHSIANSLAGSRRSSATATWAAGEPPASPSVLERRSDENRGEDGNRPQIHGRRMGEHGAAGSLEKAGPVGDVRFKIAASSIDQVIADVGRTIRRRSLSRRLACALDRAQRDAHLGVAARRGQVFDRLPLPVTAQKIHSSVRARRVTLQDLLDEAHRLDVRLPVERRAQREDS